MIITYIPVILGSGASLFPNKPKASIWKLSEIKCYDNGVSQTSYRIEKTGWQDIKTSIIQSLLSRGLKSPEIRLNALNRIEQLLKENMPEFINNSIESFRKTDKTQFKDLITRIKANGKLNDAESSVINEIYYRI